MHIHNPGKEPHHKRSSFESFQVHSMEVACDGGGGALGHPKVYLHIDQSVGHITCPYCSRSYVLASSGVR